MGEDAYEHTHEIVINQLCDKIAKLKAEKHPDRAAIIRLQLELDRAIEAFEKRKH